VETALEFGLEVVKFFPAEQAGGLDYIKAIAAPYPNLKFMPTGGINAGNIGTYLAYEKILACGGSWMAGPDLINAGNFDAITALCKEAVNKVLNFSVVRLGINAENEEAALKGAKTFEAIFGFTAKPGNSSVFAGDGIEIMKSPYLGKYGHIAIGTYNVGRAAAHLERRGVPLNQGSAKLDSRGRLSTIYLADEIAGFAVHLIKK
jgi:2-dehydro-3-deoxyphosphogluconate aldolase/(4S)-4-hydroxy-2-oxoglutarate aldolase